MRRALAAGAFAAIVGFAGAASAAGFQPVELRTLPIPVFKPGSSETKFGALTFLGGLTLLSREVEFSSWSGIDFAPDGKTFVAIADTGQWLTARLVEANGRLVGLEAPRMGVMLVDDGKPSPNKVGADAEGLRLVVRNGVETALVSFEQSLAVRSYAGPDFSASRPAKLTLPKFVKGIRRNQGLEALAVAPEASALGDGTIVVIAERSLDAAKNHRGFILSGPKAGAFSIRRTDEFDVSDAAFLPDGDLLVLERRFSFSGGFAMRIRRIAAAAIAPGATLDGPVLIEADDTYEIDNMEGLAVRTLASGETILTLISDDNHGFLQRTILLQFALPPK